MAEEYKFRVFLIDEIHFFRGFEGALKKIYDFLDVKVYFSSSVALALLESSFDLSRRVNPISMLPFSLREFAYFKSGLEVTRITIEDIIDKRFESEHLRCSPMFDAYLRGGLMPFALEEGRPLDLLENILSKILRKDIPMVARLHFEEVEIMEKMLRFIGRSEPDGINYTTLSNNLKITKYKAISYTKLLEQSFVLQAVFPAGTNVMKEPKILMSLPYRLLYRPYEDAIGGLREDFFAEMLRMSATPFHYLKTTRGAKTPDFLVTIGDDKVVMEVGGKGKGRTQFKGIKADKKIILSHSEKVGDIARPLFMLGLIV